MQAPGSCPRDDGPGARPPSGRTGRTSVGPRADRAVFSETVPDTWDFAGEERRPMTGTVASACRAKAAGASGFGFAA